MRGSFGFAAGALALFTGCASTNMTSVWKDPATPAPFKKVMVIAMTRDESLRRVAEDSFVNGMKKEVTAIASYPEIPTSGMRDTLGVKDKVKSSGCDGAIVYRLVSVDKQTSYVPGSTYVTGYGYPSYGYPYYGSFGGYYGYSSSVVYEPGYLVEDQIVQVECNAYSVHDEKLVWSGRSETVNPSSIQSLIDDVVMVTVDQMRTDKILP